MSRKRKPKPQRLSNKSQQPSYINQELLKVVQDTKVWAQELKVEPSLLNSINSIEQRLKRARAGENEKAQLRAIRKKLKAKSGRRRRWGIRGLMLLNLVKVILYFHAYLLNIPPKLYNANQAFYIFSGVVIMMVPRFRTVT